MNMYLGDFLNHILFIENMVELQSGSKANSIARVYTTLNLLLYADAHERISRKSLFALHLTYSTFIRALHLTISQVRIYNKYILYIYMRVESSYIYAFSGEYFFNGAQLRRMRKYTKRYKTSSQYWRKRFDVVTTGESSFC